MRIQKVIKTPAWTRSALRHFRSDCQMQRSHRVAMLLKDTQDHCKLSIPPPLLPVLQNRTAPSLNAMLSSLTLTGLAQNTLQYCVPQGKHSLLGPRVSLAGKTLGSSPGTPSDRPAAQRAAARRVPKGQ